MYILVCGNGLVSLHNKSHMFEVDIYIFKDVIVKDEQKLSPLSPPPVNIGIYVSPIIF